MLLNIHPENPSERKLQQVIRELEQDGVIIYPTDTVYALGCDIKSKKGLERLARIRGVNPQIARFSFICAGISQVAEYSAQIDNEIFRLMKQHLPGPFTFILKAGNQVPKLVHGKRASIGVRVPSNNIPLRIVESLGRPIITASLKNDEDDFLEYLTDARDIYDQFGKMVNLVIDGGFGGTEGSTVIDCTTNPPELIRQGAGDIELM